MRPSRLALWRSARRFAGTILTKALLTVDEVLNVLRFKQDLFAGLQLDKLANINGARFAIYAVFSNSESETKEILRVVNLVGSEFDSIIVVNTGIAKIQCDLNNVICLQRKNFGRDLGSYKAILQKLNLQNVSEIFLFNDSVFWLDLAVCYFLEFSRSNLFEVSGVTISTQNTFHLQSYAIHIKGDVSKITTPLLTLRISRFKRGLIDAGEKELSNHWLEDQIRVGSLHNQTSLLSNFAKYQKVYGKDFSKILNLVNNQVPLNPSIHLWAPLLEESRIIKKSLIFANPARLQIQPKTIEEALQLLELD